MPVLLFAGLALGMAKGAYDAYSYSQQWDEKKKQLETDKKNLKDSFDLKVKNMAEELEEGNAKLQSDIQDAKYVRETNLRESASNVGLQEQINNLQMAELQVQQAEAVGSAVQGLATSGVRRLTATQDDALGVRSGDVMNAGVFRTRQASERGIALARLQADLSRRQGIENARMNYLNATMNMESYRRQIAENGKVKYDENGNIIGGTGKFGRAYSEYKLSYDQQASAYQEELDYMNSPEATRMGILNMFFSTLSGGIGGATSMATLA